MFTHNLLILLPYSISHRPYMNILKFRPALQYIHFYGANPHVRAGPKAAKLMNRFPNHGSSYRGNGSPCYFSSPSFHLILSHSLPIFLPHSLCASLSLSLSFSLSLFLLLCRSISPQKIIKLYYHNKFDANHCLLYFTSQFFL